MLIRTHLVTFKSFIVSLLLFVSPIVTAAEFGDVLVFGGVDAVARVGLDKSSTLDNGEIIPLIDLFYARNDTSFQLLAELVLSEEEQEFERLQIGWDVGRHGIMWFGRYHNPIGYWNTQYHHGAFLQSTVSRPAFIEYEDDAGMLPMHLAGLYYQSDQLFNFENINLEFAIGNAPKLGDDNLEPYEFFGENSGHVATTLNIVYQAEGPRIMKTGFSISISEISSKNHKFGEHDLSVYTVYNHSTFSQQDFLISASYVDVKSEDTGLKLDDGAKYAYIQYGHTFVEKIHLTSRIELADFDSKKYFGFYAPPVEKQYVLGVGYDINERNTIKLELIATDDGIDEYRKIIFRWAWLYP